MSNKTMLTLSDLNPNQFKVEEDKTVSVTGIGAEVNVPLKKLHDAAGVELSQVR